MKKEKKMFKRVIFFLIVTIVHIHQLNSASELTHAYIAKRWLNYNKKSAKYSEAYRSAFIRGTLFPDIRYFADISRENTHDKNVTLQEIFSCDDAFEAGKKLHAFVDEFIDEPENKKKLTDIKKIAVKILQKKAPDVQKHVVMLLKFAEDDIIFTQNDRCHEIPKYFGKLDATMRTFNVPDKKLHAWYKLLKTIYFSGKISSESFSQPDIVNFFKNIPAHELSQFGPSIKALAKNKQIKKYTRDRLREFDKRFKIFFKNQKKSNATTATLSAAL